MRALIVIALLALPMTARADDAMTRARRFFRAGSIAYERGHYGEAIRAFEEADKLVDSPALTFSLAQAYRRQFFVDRDDGKAKRAHELFTAYVRTEPDGRRKPDAVEQIQHLEVALFRLEQSARTAEPPPAPTPPATELFVYSEAQNVRVSIDGAPPVDAPLVRTVTPGRHELTAEAPGYQPARVGIDAASDRLTPVSLELEPKPARLAVEAERGAEIFVDGVRLGVAPLPFELALPPGPHRIDGRLRGHALVSEPIVAERDEAMKRVLAFEPTPRRETANVVLGTSAAFAVAGLATTIAALVVEANAQDVDAMRGAVNIEPDALDDYNADVRRRNTLRTTSVVLFSTSAVLGLIGGGLWLFDQPDLPPPPTYLPPPPPTSPF